MIRRNSKAGKPMATTQRTPKGLRKTLALAAPWGKIGARRAFGDSGPGLDVDLLTPKQVADATSRAAPGRPSGAYG